MAMTRTPWIWLGVLATALAACKASPVATLVAQKPVPASEQASLASLQIQVREQASSAKYRLKYLTQLDWDQATATLTNSAGVTGLPGPINQAAVVDPASASRSAAFSFPALKASRGYTLSIALKRDGATIGSGTATFTLRPGPNQVAVSLSLDPSGKVVVSVQPPTLAGPGLQTNVMSQSGYTVEALSSGTVGGLADGNGTSATFGQIAGLELDPTGALYVADLGFNRIRKVVPAGGGYYTVSTVAGTSSTEDANPDDGAPGTSVNVQAPCGMAYDHANKALLIAEKGDNKLLYLDLDTGSVFKFAGGNGTGVATDALNVQLDQPFDVAIDNGASGVPGSIGGVFFTEQGTANRVRRIDPDRNTTTIKSGLSGAGPLAIDLANDRLWVAHGNQVKLLSGIYGTSASDQAFDVSPIASGADVITGLAYDQNDTLYLARANSAGDARAQVFRIVLDASGLPKAGRQFERIAGNLDPASGSQSSYVVSGAGPAGNRQLAGLNWCGLTVDTRDLAAAPANVASRAGTIYTGNSNAAGGTAWGQPIRLVPQNF